MVSPVGDKINKFMMDAAQIAVVGVAVVVGAVVAVPAALVVSVAAIPINIVGQTYFGIKKAINNLDMKALSKRVALNNGEVQAELAGANLNKRHIKSELSDKFLNRYKGLDGPEKINLIKELAQACLIKEKIKKNNKINSSMKFTASLFVPGLNLYAIGKKMLDRGVGNVQNNHEIAILKRSLRKIEQADDLVQGRESVVVEHDNAKKYARQVAEGKVSAEAAAWLFPKPAKN